jgi:hypothetical protein
MRPTGWGSKQEVVDAGKCNVGGERRQKQAAHPRAMSDRDEEKSDIEWWNNRYGTRSRQDGESNEAGGISETGGIAPAGGAGGAGVSGRHGVQ